MDIAMPAKADNTSEKGFQVNLKMAKDSKRIKRGYIGEKKAPRTTTPSSSIFYPVNNVQGFVRVTEQLEIPTMVTYNLTLRLLFTVY